VTERWLQKASVSESNGKPWFKEAFNEIELATSSFAWNFNKRLDPISLDWFIYPLLSLATSEI
jgi:hypothetical protein